MIPQAKSGDTQGTTMHPLHGKPELIRGMTRKVLIVADVPEDRNLLSTFLASMGCEDVASSSEEALSHLREAFDAIVLSLPCTQIPVKQVVLAIERTAPTLSKQLLLITDDIDAETRELILLHSLAHVHRGRLFQQLWPNLQSLFALEGSGDATPQGAKVGRLVFDSFRQPLPMGVRASVSSNRQLVYEYDDIKVDIAFEPVSADKIALKGQVLGTREHTEQNDKILVFLIPRRGSVKSTTANQFGEFNLEFDFIENIRLEIRVGERTWVSTPPISLTWAKRRAVGTDY